MPQGPPDSLIQRPHAQILVVVFSLKVNGPIRIIVSHLCLYRQRLSAWVRKAEDNHSAGQAIAEVYPLRELTADDTEKDRFMVVREMGTVERKVVRGLAVKEGVVREKESARPENRLEESKLIITFDKDYDSSLDC